MKILDSARMKSIDARTIGVLGIPGIVLMENAGLAVCRALVSRFPEPRGLKVVIAVGKGSNGGDGSVAARHLFNGGYDVTIFLAGEKAGLSGDAAVNIAAAASCGVPVVEMKSEAGRRRFGRDAASAGVIIDALFGTGLQKPLEGWWAGLVEDINSSRAFRLAVDLPSGLSADTLEIIGPAVRADLTVTLAAPKIPLVFPPASGTAGEVMVVDISIPPVLFRDPALKMELVEDADVRPLFAPRKKDSHKGSYGHVLVIAGSVGKSGAAALAGKAALKTGAGLVTVATAAGALDSVARTMPELMTEPLKWTEGGAISEEALPRALELLSGKDALLIGPGLTTGPSTAAFVRSLLPKVRVPMVIDADGLNIVASDERILSRLRAPAVLTPHPGEFSRLAGASTAEVLRRRLEVVPAFARKFGVMVVFKGFRTMTVTADGRIFVNPTGNPGMASGGSGDVLGGMIASQAAQEKDLMAAAVSAVYLHGLAGDLAAEALSEKALTASDIIRYIPAAARKLQKEAGS